MPWSDLTARHCRLVAATLTALVPSVKLAAQAERDFVVTVGGREKVVSLPKAIPGCPRAPDDEDEIVICATPRGAERYRLPRQGCDPAGPVASVSRERHQIYEQGDSGIGSCSTVGPGGWTGCAMRAWKAAREQHGR